MNLEVVIDMSHPDLMALDADRRSVDPFPCMSRYAKDQV